MRVGPFSDSKVIDYLNRHFVPIYVSNQEYLAGTRGKDELALLRGIWKAEESKGLQSGSVHVSLLTSDGDPIDTLHVRDAADTRKLMRFLASNIRKLNVEAGETLIPPRMQSVRPSLNDDQIVLHISTTYQEAFRIPREDWIMLKQDEWKQFIPDEDAKPYQEWRIDDALAKKILVNVYPYTQDWGIRKDQVTMAELNAYILDRSQHRVLVAVRGKVHMLQNRYPGSDPKMVIAEIVGRVIVEPNNKPQITITTGQAVFNNRGFDGLIESVDTNQLPEQQSVATGAE